MPDENGCIIRLDDREANVLTESERFLLPDSVIPRQESHARSLNLLAPHS